MSRARVGRAVTGRMIALTVADRVVGVALYKNVRWLDSQVRKLAGHERGFGHCEPRAVDPLRLMRCAAAVAHYGRRVTHSRSLMI